MTTKKDSADILLFVKDSHDEILVWDSTKISDALIREANVEESLAKKIAEEVSVQIKNVKHITSSLVRELVNCKLIEYGLEEAREKHQRLGVSIAEAEKIITCQNKENANIPNNPEAINLTFAEIIIKEFALTKCLSKKASFAHSTGDIHIHDLGFFPRVYCGGQSLEYLKKFGLTLPGALSIALPAKHPEVLLAHMVKMSAALQGCFAGAIGWDAVNLFFAPLLVGKTDEELEQLAQILIFEFSQQAVARGGQAVFSDINLYWEVPKHFENTPAIGSGGTFTGKTYKEYEKESQRFLTAIFNVYLKGDAAGKPFFFPKPNLHITENLFKTKGYEEFLYLACKVAIEKGNTYFVFDRGETVKISECCRLALEMEQEDIEDAKHPWKMRFNALQNNTINLPRLAYKAKGNDEKLFSFLDECLEICAEVHISKRKFIDSLLSLGTKSPLALLLMDRDGESYLRRRKSSYLIGMVGLNELVQFHTGKELHESKDALKFGLKVISHMNLKCKELRKKYDLKFVLEQTPAESTAYRFAMLDLKYFPEEAKKVVKGNIVTKEVYYTNSTHLNIGAPINPIQRITTEGLFHNMIEAGALTHVWLGESLPSVSSLANLIIKIFRNTENAQVAFSPEFTICNTCGKVVRGIKTECEKCKNIEIKGVIKE